MAKKKKLIGLKKERVILSDVLPYEVPITFSNRFLYNFLVSHNVIITGGKVEWIDNSTGGAIGEVIKLLFGIVGNELAQPITGTSRYYMQLDEKRGRKTVPFNYKISHKESDFRDLTVVHPLNQLSVVDFYEVNKDLILHYCNVSPFSVRRPDRVAKFTYYKDKLHNKNIAHDHAHKMIEEADKEYESLKTFFSYRDYSNIYKFYESYRYLRSEKKFKKLLKFDVSKCFDSIYSHSLPWALLNKEIVKDNIGSSNSTFGGRFDTLMQNLNYGETNGIVIGPEFSRIFAELILQRVDLDAFHCLEKENVRFKTDYEIYRYVDDFFVFYNEDAVKDKILETYKIGLREYKMYLNDSKSIIFERPIITGITRAKQKIADLLDRGFAFHKKEDQVVNSSDEEEEKEIKYSFYISSNKLITRFKAIIVEAGISYKDILNYTIACIDKKISKLIDLYGQVDDKKTCEEKVTKALLEILDFTFFLYSVAPRVNTTIKLCTTLGRVITFCRDKESFGYERKSLVFKKIYDEISLVLERSKNSEHVQVETLYLLIALKQIGREYRLDEKVLCRYFGINLEKGSFKNSLNYFSITVLLFYIEKKKRYAGIKKLLEGYILRKFTDVPIAKRRKTTELSLLLFDMLSCPSIDDTFKKSLLLLYEIKDSVLQDGIINFKGKSSDKKAAMWFTKWTEFDFEKELRAKKSREVY